MRYINKQQHQSSCGPVAVLNALKWIGRPYSYRDNLDCFRKLGFKFDTGTSVHNMEIMLSEFLVDYHRLKQPKVRDLERQLEQGHSIILQFRWRTTKGSGRHFTFIDGHTPCYFKLHNCGASLKKTYRNWFKWSKTKDRRKYVDPTAFIISKAQRRI